MPRMLGADSALEIIAAGKDVGADQALKIGLVAVSYTHLDVYKRQPLPHLLANPIWAHPMARGPKVPLCGLATLCGISSVSYTHLDVYKRQSIRP